MTTTALSLVQQYPPDKYNLLLPTTAAVDVSQWHRMSVSLVQISPEPRLGDVYQVGSRKKKGARGNSDEDYEELFSLARPATDRIGTAAGINYDPSLNRVVSANSDYVVYETVGGIRRPDGTWVVFKATKEIDLKAIEMELREAETQKVTAGLLYEAGKSAAQMYQGAWKTTATKWGEKEAFFIVPGDLGRAIDDRVRPQMIQWRKNKLMRCETGSRLRVIRGLLGIRMQFTTEELTRPFVVPRIDFAPPLNDPEVKRLFLIKAAGAVDSLYGGRAIPANMVPADARVIEVVADDDDDAPMHGSAFRVEPVVTPVDDAQSVREHFGASAPVAEQTSAHNEPPAPAGSDQAQKGRVDTEQHTCTACQAIITEKVANYSVSKFGRKLCMKCQKGGGQ